MATICEIKCAKMFSWKVKPWSLFQNFMGRNRKKYNWDFDVIKSELKRYKNKRKVNQMLHHWYINFFSFFSILYSVILDRNGQKKTNIVLYRFLFEKKKLWSWSARNYLQFSEEEKQSFYPTHSLWNNFSFMSKSFAFVWK